MEEKYTMEEFKEMFEKAKEEVLEEEAGNFEKIGKENDVFNPMASAMFNIQNMILLVKLQEKLFGDK